MSTTNRILIKKREVTLSQPPRVIGRGAMGEVYLASFRGKTVVVKKSQVKKKKKIQLIKKTFSPLSIYLFPILSFCSET